MTEGRQEGLLNEHQRRALSTRLTMLDRFLSDVEQLLSGSAPRGEMFEVVNDLSEEQKQNVRSLVKEARNELRISRRQLNLEIKREYVHRWLAGHLSIFWTILEDTRAAKLAGFGDVSPALAAELDPQIENLIRIVNSLKSIVIE
jgi:hypothetical protein